VFNVAAAAAVVVVVVVVVYFITDSVQKLLNTPTYVQTVPTLH
jgi:uncharacterized protein HemY